MKQFSVKQSGSEVILEEVNPHEHETKNWYKCVEFERTKLTLTSIDPNIKVDQVIREDQLEITTQYKHPVVGWTELYTNVGKSRKTRQVAKLKQPVQLSDKIGHLHCDPEALKDPEFVKAINQMAELAYRKGKSEQPKTAISNVLDLWHTLDEDDRVLALTKFKSIIDQPVHETPKSGHDLETCTEKEEKGTPLPNLDFTSLFNYVKSLQSEMGLTAEEASTVFYIINMWDKKKVYDPEFKMQ